ncbi:site-specific integrase [Streptomyces rubiginosohelvolus]|uniref:hypothetical protein n=1 Tax=Streptomyces rubiginosohelvolus TaxID=67362 RepID=UPI0036793D8B
MTNGVEVWEAAARFDRSTAAKDEADAESGAQAGVAQFLLEEWPTLPPERYPLGWEKSRNKMTYALRHLYASMMINGGVDVYILADRLGHADPE